MLFSIHIGDKLDLSKFRKQAVHYIGQMREVTYDIYSFDYKMIVACKTSESSTAHEVTIRIEELKRDADKEITMSSIICPLNDTRFNEIKIIQDIFTIPGSQTAKFSSNSVSHTVDRICSLIKIIHKINGLKAFV